MTASVSVVYKPNAAFKPQLLNSAGVMAIVDEKAQGIRSRASGMFGATSYKLVKARAGKVRCHAYVVTGDLHAMRSNALHMTLNKALKG